MQHQQQHHDVCVMLVPVLRHPSSTTSRNLIFGSTSNIKVRVHSERANSPREPVVRDTGHGTVLQLFDHRSGRNKYNVTDKHQTKQILLSVVHDN